MHLAVIGRQHQQAVAFLHHFLDGRAAGDAVLGAPVVGGQAARPRTVDFPIGVRHLKLPAGRLFNPLRVIVGVPFIQKIINKSDGLHTGSPSPVLSTLYMEKTPAAIAVFAF